MIERRLELEARAAHELRLHGSDVDLERLAGAMHRLFSDETRAMGGDMWEEEAGGRSARRC